MSDTVVLEKAPVSFQKGDVIAGKYRLEHELGRGAMGTVWAATHTTLGQRVAIKLIARDHTASPEARHRFSLEAKAAARLKSRHAVQVYDDGETPEGVPYIVMEYLEGESLEARLQRQHDLGLPEAIRITSHVGRALARAHARGIVHRDLKSGNVFIARTDDDELGWIAKVLDFGVAKLTDMSSASTTKTGTIVGTPLFMSPEQIRGASLVDHRADLYSLGMVFYNMVTGSHAFDGPSYSDVLVAICTEPLPDIRDKAPWLPESVGEWFAKACAREPEARFQSADEMIEALRDAAGTHARLSRPSVPDDVSGPSGTIVGHAPPHAATVQIDAPRIELAALPADNNTLRSRTGPSQASDPPLRASEPVVVVEAPRARIPYVVLALAGAGCALFVITAVVAVRSAFETPAPSATTIGTTPAAGEQGAPSARALEPRVETAPSRAVVEPERAPAEPTAEPTAAPPAAPASTATVERRAPALPAKPRAESPPARRVPVALPSATQIPAPARPEPPDMGF